MIGVWKIRNGLYAVITNIVDERGCGIVFNTDGTPVAVSSWDKNFNNKYVIAWDLMHKISLEEKGHPEWIYRLAGSVANLKMDS